MPCRIHSQLYAPFVAIADADYSHLGGRVHTIRVVGAVDNDKALQARLQREYLLEELELIRGQQSVIVQDVTEVSVSSCDGGISKLAMM